MLRGWSLLGFRVWFGVTTEFNTPSLRNLTNGCEALGMKEYRVWFEDEGLALSLGNLPWLGFTCPQVPLPTRGFLGISKRCGAPR